MDFLLIYKDMERHIHITSSSQGEFETTVFLGVDKYLVQTEDMGIKTAKIITKTYRKGQILSTITTDYRDITNEPDLKERVHDLMHKQHKQAIKALHEEARTPSEYLNSVLVLLRRKNKKAAISHLEEALQIHPDEPFLLSYYGCLQAIVEKRYKEGVSTCKRAIERLKASVPFGEEFFYPVFYLNLGRAYLAEGDRKEAFGTFMKGLSYDNENKDLLWEIKKLGIRKKPAISFLPRGNPLNKYIGLLLSKVLKGR
ncbi:MAG: hypothetical protein HY805_04885 [Nitrospirae bacterium]|nr:hypothetical protein [Nitrospirota bacterium]